MEKKQDNTECMITGWGIAAFVGFLAMVMLYWIAGFDLNQTVFSGGLIGAVLGFGLSLTICGQQTAAEDLSSEEKPAARYAREAEERRKARIVTTLGADAAEVAINPKTSTPPSVAAHTAAPGAAATLAPADKKPAPTAPAAAAPADAPAATEDDRPKVLLGAARAGGKDDLKLIGGVGPKLEETLNDLGVYHFDQVAKFTKADIAWVDERLRFKGRIERDDWMSQAKTLAAGGETEFSKGKKKT
jgi:predicted flap endonuclease-1-like 5' DNA nuclease